MNRNLIVKVSRFLTLIGILACMPTQANANDSAAAIGLGGLQLKQNDAISMDSEELFLSMDRVTVKYRFTNTTDKDVETLVSFPLPAIPDDLDQHMGDRGYPIWKDLDFKTEVDGVPVKLDYHHIATVDGKDVTKRLNALGWPLDYWSNPQKFPTAQNFMRDLANMPQTEKDAFVAEGLLKPYDDGYPAWSVSTHVTRKQIFPANQTITVEHSYRPITGGTNGGNMSAYARKNPDNGFDWFRKTYCMDDSFIAGFDRKYNARDKEKREQYVELFLDYRLSPGANWKGPIKKFRLVVDKGLPTNLVSFCMDGIRKISPTQFEVTKANFEPTKDLQILIVRWFDIP